MSTYSFITFKYVHIFILRYFKGISLSLLLKRMIGRKNLDVTLTSLPWWLCRTIIWTVRLKCRSSVRPSPTFYLPCAREIPPPSHALAIPFPDESARSRLDLDTTPLEPSQSLSHPPPPSRRPPDAALAIASREPTPPPRRGNLIRSCPSSPPVARPGAPPSDEVQAAPVGACRRAPTKIQPELRPRAW